MSVFSAIIKDLKSFASKIEQEFVKLFKQSPTWLQLVGSIVTYATPLVVTVVSIINPIAGSATATVLSRIQASLALLKAATADIANQPTAIAALQALQQEIPDLLSAIKVENPDLVSKIETDANAVLNEIVALLESVPASTSTAAA